MHRCNTPAEVVAFLRDLPVGIIAVDGFQGSGKTTLAKQLGNSLDRDVLSADDFLHRNQGSFYAHLDMTKLSEALDRDTGCILEGICCLQVLRDLGLRPASLVYVKRMAMWGWADEDELLRYAAQELPKNSPAEPIALALRNLWDEVAKYHAEYRPHELAKVVYERSAA